MSACIRRRHAFWTTCPCAECSIDRCRKAKQARTIGIARVPSDAAWHVIDDLTARGWSGWAIASAAGLPRRSVEGALTRLSTEGHRSTFGPLTAAAIVNHGEPTHGTVGVTPSRRRLQGLARQGWDLDTLSEMCGLGASSLAMIRTGRTQHVRVTAAKTVRDLTDRIGMKIGTSEQARKNAERKGWPSLIAWDDIDYDEHPADDDHDEPEVDHSVVERLLAGERVPSTRAEKVEAMRRWMADGNSERSLCAIHGWRAGRYAERQEAAA